MNSTLWRTMSYEALKRLSIDGEILDLGGSRKSGYHELIGGTHSFKVVNIDSEYGYDLKFDIEKPFPLDSSTFDAVLLVNALEHVFNYRTTLAESWRVLRHGGKAVVVVPFLMPVHPCPHDYWRYTGETLERILGEAGFSDVTVTAIGRGPFTAAAHMRFNLYKIGLLRKLTYFIAGVLDSVVLRFKKETYGPDAYPLGYVAVAKK